MPNKQGAVSSEVRVAAAPDVSTTGKHIPALDGVRGLAVLLVLGFHFLWANMYSGHNPVIWTFSAVKNIGWIGVDLFFVLSGFLITGILYDTQRAKRFFRNFYARRALRIFPLYYTVLIGSVLLCLALGGTTSFWGLLQSLTYTRNLIFPQPLSYPPVWGVPWIQLNHFWSLAIEEQFYFVWPLMVFLLKTRRKIAVAAVLGIAASFATRVALLHYSQLHTYPYLLSSWTPSRLDGLFAGALLAMAVRSRWEQKVLRVSGWAMAVGVVSLVLLGLRYPYWNVLLYPKVSLWYYPLAAWTFAAMIACGLRAKSWLSRFFSLPAMRFFGRYSYGLYVYHYTIAELAGMMRPRVLALTHSKILAVALPAVLGFGVTVLIALASFHWFESRFLRFKRKFEDHTRGPKLEEYVAEGAES